MNFYSYLHRVVGEKIKGFALKKAKRKEIWEKYNSIFLIINVLSHQLIFARAFN